MKTYPAITFMLIFFMTFKANSQTANNFSDCNKAGCHISQLNHDYIHSPVEDDCMICHETNSSNHPVVDKNDFKLTSKVPELCLDCHDMDDTIMNVHSPFSDGECLSCHTPHGSENEMFLIESGADLCLQCHDSYSEKKFIHGPVAGGMCSACHNPHYSSNENLLLREGQDVCLFCHTQKKEIQNKASVHKPFLEGCMRCHTPHASEAKYLMAVDVPELCYTCHQTVEVSLDKKSEVHGPFQVGGKCYLCHDAHVSDFSPLLQAKEQDICFQCHNKKLQNGEYTIRDIERCVKSKFSHEPVVSSGCSACHAAHTPDNFFLLSAAFPTGSYTEGKAENFAHCFDCHDPALMEEETGTASNFREGERNMHFVHVNREKARNCTTCHNIHGSKYPHLVAEKVPFGKWEMPMNFKKTDNGGSCQTGCHKFLEYDRTAVTVSK